jgi:hypothetical protein
VPGTTGLNALNQQFQAISDCADALQATVLAQLDALEQPI